MLSIDRRPKWWHSLESDRYLNPHYTASGHQRRSNSSNSSQETGHVSKMTSVTTPLIWMVCSNAPEVGSHNLIIWPSESDATIPQSGENTLDWEGMAFQGTLQSCRSPVPKFDCAVIVAGCYSSYFLEPLYYDSRIPLVSTNAKLLQFRPICPVQCGRVRRSCDWNF